MCWLPRCSCDVYHHVSGVLDALSTCHLTLHTSVCGIPTSDMCQMSRERYYVLTRGGWTCWLWSLDIYICYGRRFLTILSPIIICGGEAAALKFARAVTLGFLTASVWGQGLTKPLVRPVEAGFSMRQGRAWGSDCTRLVWFSRHPC